MLQWLACDLASLQTPLLHYHISLPCMPIDMRVRNHGSHARHGPGPAPEHHIRMGLSKGRRESLLAAVIVESMTSAVSPSFFSSDVAFYHFVDCQDCPNLYGGIQRPSCFVSPPLKIRAVAASWPGRPAWTRYPQRHQLQAKNPKRVGLRSDNSKPLQASKYFLHFSYYVIRTATRALSNLPPSTLVFMI